MKIQSKWGTHLAPLVACLLATRGPVLELGMGLFSTPVLHTLCALHRRDLVSYDSEPAWLTMYETYQSPRHTLRHVSSYDDAVIEQPWDVVLVDHLADRRKIDAMRLAAWARFVVVHDTSRRDERHYHLAAEPSINSAFRYRYDYAAVKPPTSVFSNIEPVAWLGSVLDGVV